MLKDQLERSVLLGMGLISLTREKAQKMVEEMMKQGEVARDEVKELTDRLVERGREERQAVRGMIEEEVDTTLKDMRLATQQELQQLQARVETLEAQMAEQFEQGDGEESATDDDA
jgi:polyhydroxyalkanoate synthesis regulator phasin